MKLYLVRHGEALPAEVDPQKGLSLNGRNKIHEVGRAIKQLHKVDLTRILHSGKARAFQTAEILKLALAPSVIMEETLALSPEADISQMMAEIEGGDGEWMLVSHLPYLTYLSGALAAGNASAEVVTFSPGTCACLAQSGDGWAIEWVYG